MRDIMRVYACKHMPGTWYSTVSTTISWKCSFCLIYRAISYSQPPLKPLFKFPRKAIFFYITATFPSITCSFNLDIPKCLNKRKRSSFIIDTIFQEVTLDALDKWTLKKRMKWKFLFTALPAKI